MPTENLNRVTSLIESLNIDDSTKSKLLQKFNGLQKNLRRAEFRLDRTLRDKEIVVNVLNATITELKEKQAVISQTNDLLSEQKQEIQEKNEALETQKRLVVEHSNQLQLNLKKLEISYHELEQFAYIASHDLKSPLRTISNFAQLLKRNFEGELGEEADEFIHYIVTGAQHMNEVICDLLEYSRVGNKNKNFNTVKLIDVIDLVKFNLTESIKETDAKIIIEEPLPEITANRSSLLQLFQNLIGNGIKFCENKTPEIRISTKQLKNKWEFRIQDNGIGIAKGYQDKVFLPFQRLNNIDRPGTGIGLAICKKSVKMHGGEIWFESQPGEGTTFIFTIVENKKALAANEILTPSANMQ